MIERRHTAAIDESASPLKPSVERCNKSVSVSILLVACGRAQFCRSLFVMPEPLSTIRTFSMPPESISTAMPSAPESTALSMSSRTIAFGRSMTSPAAIFLATSAESCRTGFASLIDACPPAGRPPFPSLRRYPKRDRVRAYPRFRERVRS